MDWISAAWHAASATVAASGPALTVVTALVAAVAVFAPRLWPTTRHLVTIAHEGGHAVVAVVVGRRR